MWDQTEYINYIRHYAPVIPSYDWNPSGEQSVNYIEQNYDQRIAEDNPMTFMSEQTNDIILPQPPEDFDLNDVYKVFIVRTAQWPTPDITATAAPFDGNNICPVFTIYSNYAYPTPLQPIQSMEYIITTNFIQTPPNYPVAFHYPEAFDVNGIYTIFKYNDEYFHGFPCPRVEFPEEIEPTGWVRIWPDNIDEYVEIGTETINEDAGLTTEFVYPAIKDRDEYHEAYIAECNKYWNFYS